MSLFKHMTDKVTTVAGKVAGKAQKGLTAAGMALAGALVSAKAAYYGLTLQYASAAPFAAGNKYDSSSDTTGLGNIIGYIMNGLTVGGVIFIIIGGISIAVSIKSGDQNPEAITGAMKNIVVGGLITGLSYIVGNLIK